MPVWSVIRSYDGYIIKLCKNYKWGKPIFIPRVMLLCSNQTLNLNAFLRRKFSSAEYIPETFGRRFGHFFSLCLAIRPLPRFLCQKESQPSFDAGRVLHPPSCLGNSKRCKLCRKWLESAVCGRKQWSFVQWTPERCSKWQWLHSLCQFQTHGRIHLVFLSLPIPKVTNFWLKAIYSRARSYRNNKVWYSFNCIPNPGGFCFLFNM